MGKEKGGNGPSHHKDVKEKSCTKSHREEYITVRVEMRQMGRRR